LCSHVTERIVADSLVADPNDFTHPPSFGSEFWLSKQRSQNRGNFRGARVRQAKADYAKLLGDCDFAPKVPLVDCHEGGLILMPKQLRDVLVLDDRIRAQVSDEADSPPIPFTDFPFKMAA
jgi:hypothetical protein